MSDLVAASGMSIGNIYRYFASKDELVAAVAEGRDGTVNGTFRRRSLLAMSWPVCSPTYRRRPRWHTPD